MSEDLRIVVETAFNIAYLLVVWGIVIAMLKRWSAVTEEDRGAALWVMLAFAFLALGDTGHVGFRVLAFAGEGIETKISFMGTSWYLVALGSIATAWTFTIFYICMLFMWRARYNKKFDAFAWLFIALAVVRSIIMLLPYNNWNSLEFAEPWYVIRNIPLMLMQVCTAYLILRDAAPVRDKVGKWMAYMIIVSLVCYAFVVMFIGTNPGVGMLMIPKTMAYLVIAIISLQNASGRTVKGNYRGEELS